MYRPRTIFSCGNQAVLVVRPQRTPGLTPAELHEFIPPDMPNRRQLVDLARVVCSTKKPREALLAFTARQRNACLELMARGHVALLHTIMFLYPRRIKLPEFRKVRLMTSAEWWEAGDAAIRRLAPDAFAFALELGNFAEARALAGMFPVVPVDRPQAWAESELGWMGIEIVREHEDLLGRHPEDLTPEETRRYHLYNEALIELSARKAHYRETFVEGYYAFARSVGL